MRGRSLLYSLGQKATETNASTELLSVGLCQLQLAYCDLVPPEDTGSSRGCVSYLMTGRLEVT